MADGAAGGGDRRVRVARGRRHRGTAGTPRVPPGAGARDRGVLQRLRRARASTRPAPGTRSTSTRPSRRAWRRTGPTWGSDERALRRRRRRLGRGRRSRRGRARGARPPRAPARAGPAPDGRRLHPLGGEGNPRPVVADPVRADRRRRRRRGRADRRPLRRRQHDDQHQGRAARAREGLRQVARGERAPRRRRRAVRRRRPRRRTTTGSRARLGVRERTDWPKSVRTVEPGFRALGAPLEPVRSYTDGNCMRCGSCLQGCPTNAGKSTLNTYIHDAWAAGRLELRAECARRADRDRGRRGDRRRVRRRRRQRSSAWTPARSSSPPER